MFFTTKAFYVFISEGFYVFITECFYTFITEGFYNLNTCSFLSYSLFVETVVDYIFCLLCIGFLTYELVNAELFLTEEDGFIIQFKNYILSLFYFSVFSNQYYKK